VRETDIQTERSREGEAGCLVLSPRPGEREAGRQGHPPNDIRRRPRHHPRPVPGYHGDPGDRDVVSLEGVFVVYVAAPRIGRISRIRKIRCVPARNEEIVQI